MAGISEDKYSGGDPVSTLAKARKVMKAMKDRNSKLSERADLLLENNARFAQLVMLLEGKVKTLTEENAKVYKYSFTKGGWMEKGSADVRKLRVRKGDVSVQKINDQLGEILRLIKQHKR